MKTLKNPEANLFYDFEIISEQAEFITAEESHSGIPFLLFSGNSEQIWTQGGQTSPVHHALRERFFIHFLIWRGAEPTPVGWQQLEGSKINSLKHLQKAVCKNEAAQWKCPTQQTRSRDKSDFIKGPKTRLDWALRNLVFLLRVGLGGFNVSSTSENGIKNSCNSQNSLFPRN